MLAGLVREWRQAGPVVEARGFGGERVSLVSFCIYIFDHFYPFFVVVVYFLIIIVCESQISQERRPVRDALHEMCGDQHDAWFLFCVLSRAWE